MKSNFKAKMIFITELLLIGFVVFYAIFLFFRTSIFKTITVTLGVLLFHFAMRLFVNWFFKSMKGRPWNHTNKWFRERNYERGLFKVLRVASWKNHIPDYNPEDFDQKQKKLSKMISNSCREEVTHIVMIIANFLPILLPISLSGVNFWLLFWLSVLGGIIDLMFILKQRYNRPRMVKAFHSQESQRKEFYMNN